MRPAGKTALITDAARAMGLIDVLVNDAVVFTVAPVTEVARVDRDRAFAVSVVGTLFTRQALAQRMIADGFRGRAINMAHPAAPNFIGHGIKEKAISPGVLDGKHGHEVDTPLVRYASKASGKKKVQVSAHIPFGRVGTPEDLTGIAVLLARDGADYVIAQTCNVDSGPWMS
ncbi:MAG: SDR family oxidoreductase [Pseudomonadota bacterium]